MKKLTIKGWQKITTALMIFSLISVYNDNFSAGEGTLIKPFFGVTILCPNTILERIEWATLITEKLPYIGIIADLIVTNWSSISPRTWGYPGPYPIPIFAEGGFDLFFIGWNWGLDIDFVGLFDTPSITPDGDNHYQYSVPEMDWALGNYSRSFNQTDRLVYANTIQQLLYDDLPAIAILYPQKLLVLDENLEGSFNLLYKNNFGEIENWEIPGDSELHIAVHEDFNIFHNLKDRKNDSDSLWLKQIYQGLLVRDSDTLGWKGGIATSWTSNNGINYSIQLNPNAVFADGHKLNASDVEYTYTTYLNYAFHDIYGWFCLPFDENAVNIIDEYEIVIDFLGAYVFQENHLSYGIIPKHIWESVLPEDQINQSREWALNDTLDSNLLGAGPYYLDDYDNTTQVVRLKRNEYFKNWTGIEPIFEYLYFEYYPTKESAISAYEAGSIDLIVPHFGITYQDLENLTSVTTTQIDACSTEELGFNMLHPYFGTGELCPIASAESAKHIRKAINYIIPRRNISRIITDNMSFPAITPWPLGSYGFNESLLPIEYDLVKAWEHMEAAGFVIEEQIGTTSKYGLNLYVIFLPVISGGVIITYSKRNKKRLDKVN